MRVQFTVTDDEWKRLLAVAKEAGYPNVPSYCKDLALGNKTFAELWKKVKEEIPKMPTGTQFRVRDIVYPSPGVLGKQLYANQEELCVKVLFKRDGVNVFEKL